MTGLEYEYVVAKYLKHNGYTDVIVTQGSGDYGIDVVAHKYGSKYAVQCKYYNSPVSLDAVQEAVAGKVMYGCDRAMVVTNNTFTEAAKKLAAANDVLLIDNVIGSHFRWPNKFQRILWVVYLFFSSAFVYTTYETAKTQTDGDAIYSWIMTVVFLTSPFWIWFSIKFLWRLICKGFRLLFSNGKKNDNGKSLDFKEDRSDLPEGFREYLEDRERILDPRNVLANAIEGHKPNLRETVDAIHTLKTSQPKLYYDLLSAIQSAIKNNNVVNVSVLVKDLNRSYGYCEALKEAMYDMGITVHWYDLPLRQSESYKTDDYLVVTEQEFIEIIGIAEAEDNDP